MKSRKVTQQALDALLVARNLERVADHATNISEDVIFWVLGADVRHHAQAARLTPALRPSDRASNRIRPLFLMLPASLLVSTLGIRRIFSGH